jgi:hypothetical protein
MGSRGPTTPACRMEVDYPDVGRDLDRLLRLFKWLLAIPHYFVLATGRYPRGLFDFLF